MGNPAAFDSTCAKWVEALLGKHAIKICSLLKTLLLPFNNPLIILDTG